jgi:hypothetical protein
MSPAEARRQLDAAVRAELSAAFERGKQAQRHWDNTGEELLADPVAPEAFAAITNAVDRYATAVRAARVDGFLRDRSAQIGGGS